MTFERRVAATNYGGRKATGVTTGSTIFQVGKTYGKYIGLFRSNDTLELMQEERKVGRLMISSWPYGTADWHL